MAPTAPAPPAKPTSTKRSRPGGFQVGPANLPDGTYRRKAQKIKKTLIQKAKLKKSYSKLLSREPTLPCSSSALSPADEAEAGEQPEPASLELHPSRQEMLDVPAVPDPTSTPTPTSTSRDRRAKRPKPQPFYPAQQASRARAAEEDAARQAHIKAMREKEEALVRRERSRRAMAKARGTTGRDGRGGQIQGKRKLGRESAVLLERIQRSMA